MGFLGRNAWVFVWFRSTGQEVGSPVFLESQYRGDMPDAFSVFVCNCVRICTYDWLYFWQVCPLGGT